MPNFHEKCHATPVNVSYVPFVIQNVVLVSTPCYYCLCKYGLWWPNFHQPHYSMGHWPSCTRAKRSDFAVWFFWPQYSLGILTHFWCLTWTIGSTIFQISRVVALCPHFFPKKVAYSEMRLGRVVDWNGSTEIDIRYFLQRGAKIFKHVWFCWFF